MTNIAENSDIRFSSGTARAGGGGGGESATFFDPADIGAKKSHNNRKLINCGRISHIVHFRSFYPSYIYICRYFICIAIFKQYRRYVDDYQ